MHKNKTPTSLRKIISTVNTNIHYLGKWSPKALKNATRKASIYTKDADNIMSHSCKIVNIDGNECLCDADSEAIFRNINTEVGIAEILISYETSLLKHTKITPIKQLMRALRLFVQHNVFRFGKKNHGVAIGAPLAIDWASQTFAVHEMTILQDPFGKHLRLSKIFSDDKICL